MEAIHRNKRDLDRGNLDGILGDARRRYNSKYEIVMKSSRT